MLATCTTTAAYCGFCLLMMTCCLCHLSSIMAEDNVTEECMVTLDLVLFGQRQLNEKEMRTTRE